MKENKKLAKMLLDMEYVIMGISMAALFVLLFVASVPELTEVIRTVVTLLGTVLVVAGAAFAVGIEQKAGYYECGKCAHRYVPTYGQVLWAPHMGRTRKMRCPRCGQKSWNKKKLTCEETEKNKEE